MAKRHERGGKRESEMVVQSQESLFPDQRCEPLSHEYDVIHHQ